MVSLGTTVSKARQQSLAAHSFEGCWIGATVRSPTWVIPCRSRVHDTSRCQICGEKLSYRATAFQFRQARFCSTQDFHLRDLSFRATIQPRPPLDVLF